MFCPKCGSQNPDSATFCGGCGAPISANQPTAAPTPTPAAAPAPMTAQSTVATDGSVAMAAHKTGRTLAIAAAAVVVVILVIIAIVTRGFGLFAPKVSFDPKSSVEAYTWSELSELSAAIAKEKDEKGVIELAKEYNLVNSEGKLDGTQTKTVSLSNGYSTQVQIAGFVHDEKTDKSTGDKAGITFIFRNAITRHAMNSSGTNSGGWETSYMRTWLSNDVMNMLPDDLRGKIVAVNKKTNNSGGKTMTDSSVTTTSDKLWLFSLKELVGEVQGQELPSGQASYTSIYNAEGSQYKLFKDCNVNYGASNGNSILKKEYVNENGSSYWWERSCYMDSTERFCQISTSGGMSYDNAKNNYGVVPGFCI